MATAVGPPHSVGPKHRSRMAAAPGGQFPFHVRSLLSDPSWLSARQRVVHRACRSVCVATSTDDCLSRCRASAATDCNCHLGEVWRQFSNMKVSSPAELVACNHNSQARTVGHVPAGLPQLTISWWLPPEASIPASAGIAALTMQLRAKLRRQRWRWSHRGWHYSAMLGRCACPPPSFLLCRSNSGMAGTDPSPMHANHITRFQLGSRPPAQEGLWDMVAVAATLTVVGLMESIAIAKSLAERGRHSLDPNQELIGGRVRLFTQHCSKFFSPASECPAGHAAGIQARSYGSARSSSCRSAGPFASGLSSPSPSA